MNYILNEAKNRANARGNTDDARRFSDGCSILVEAAGILDLASGADAMAAAQSKYDQVSGLYYAACPYFDPSRQ